MCVSTSESFLGEKKGLCCNFHSQILTSRDHHTELYNLIIVSILFMLFILKKRENLKREMHYVCVKTWKYTSKDIDWESNYM